MSGSIEKRDDVGLQAGLDGAALVAGGAEGGLEPDALALGGLLEVGDDLVVDDLGGRVGDERQLGAAARPTRPSGSAVRRVGGAAAAGRDEGGVATRAEMRDAGFHIVLQAWSGLGRIQPSRRCQMDNGAAAGSALGSRAPR